MNRNRIVGRNSAKLLSGMIFSSALILVGCAKEDQGLDPQLFAAALLLDQSGAVRMQSAPADAQALSTNENLAGIPVSSFGDGSGDGYTDRFVDPREVGLSFFQVYAWKSPEAGGPAPGQATIENADYTLYDGERVEGRTELLPYSASEDRPGALRGLQRVPADADRIGLVIGAVFYQYKVGLMDDPQHQSVTLYWANQNDNGTVYTTHRGKAAATSRSAGCPDFFSNAGAGCSYSSQFLGEDGSYLCHDFDEPMLHSCRHTEITGGVDNLEYDFPTGAVAGEKYVHILPLAKNTGSGKLYINIDPSKTLFIDSNDPISEPFDWNSWYQTKHADQDLKFYLPVMWVTTE